MSIDTSNINNRRLFYPNPFSSSTTIKINRKLENTFFELKIYNSLGTIVRHIENIDQQVIIERNDLSAGIYLYEITVNKVLLASGRLVVK